MHLYVIYYLSLNDLFRRYACWIHSVIGKIVCPKLALVEILFDGTRSRSQS